MEEQYRHHPALIGMWHGQFMLLPLIKPNFIPVDIMVARHADAEFLGVALRQFDMRLIRGAGAAGARRIAAAPTPTAPRCRPCGRGGRSP